MSGSGEDQNNEGYPPVATASYSVHVPASSSAVPPPVLYHSNSMYHRYAPSPPPPPPPPPLPMFHGHYVMSRSSYPTSSTTTTTTRHSSTRPSLPQYFASTRTAGVRAHVSANRRLPSPPPCGRINNRSSRNNSSGGTNNNIQNRNYRNSTEDLLSNHASFPTEPEVAIEEEMSARLSPRASISSSSSGIEESYGSEDETSSPSSREGTADAPISLLQSPTIEPKEEPQHTTQRKLRSRQNLKLKPAERSVPSARLKKPSSPDQKSNNSENRCPICLDDPSESEVATIDGCHHHFCFPCIEKWADRENTCPLCKERFTNIERVNKVAKGGVSSEGPATSKRKKPSSGQDGPINSKKVRHRNQRSDYAGQHLNMGPLHGLFATIEATGAVPPAMAELVFSEFGPLVDVGFHPGLPPAHSSTAHSGPGASSNDYMGEGSFLYHFHAPRTRSSTEGRNSRGTRFSTRNGQRISTSSSSRTRSTRRSAPNSNEDARASSRSQRSQSRGAIASSSTAPVTNSTTSRRARVEEGFFFPPFLFPGSRSGFPMSSSRSRNEPGGTAESPLEIDDSDDDEGETNVDASIHFSLSIGN
eukprot:CAMPEP_0178954156 /NCGR_PEP_ID=MMETSP0789-20121207/8830_1 /TAXON_ID=3005 /ORGANISM="Rhizosolenia setigera, Strain CCMP 1694" /LENGTH=587 /DNA_ID=CAMNT_0020635519 /DNA_START=159 /DNA_END=1922 /DNA_ORIENTATION=-